MRVCVLASGSRGNATFVSSSATNLLIDLGYTSLHMEKKLNEISIDPRSIDGILITHTHVDHTSALKVFIKKYNTKLYLTQKMYEELNALFPIDNYEIIDGDFSVQDIDVKIIKTSHDASDSNGYILESNGNSVVYITDTGYINSKNFHNLSDKNIYVFESNYDVNMLMNGKYPYHIKQRILSDKGHLSNEDSSYYLSRFIGDNTKVVILAHLSQENNNPDIALNTLKNCLIENNIAFNNIIIAKQEERTEVFEL